MEFEEYHKIENVYSRDPETKKIKEGEFTNPEFEYLANNIWEFTEKIDGTNIRVCWDGHKVQFKGRTENAQIPAELANRLFELFGGDANEQLWEQKFGEVPVMLVGEGYGAKIQSGGDYSPTQEFILFDVKIGSNWQPRVSVSDIADYFKINTVPTVLFGTLQDGVNYVKACPPSYIGNGKATAEGIVGRPVIEMQSRTGRRIIVKIKCNDYKEK